jgi:hypothetical protein
MDGGVGSFEEFFFSMLGVSRSRAGRPGQKAALDWAHGPDLDQISGVLLRADADV